MPRKKKANIDELISALDEHVADILVDKEFEVDSILDAGTETFENKEKAKMILAQIHDKLNPNNM